MSTRCNIKVKDESDTLWFYRHSDGYPEVALEPLERFMQFVADGKIRDNVGQACGWLTEFGRQEYSVNVEDLNSNDGWSWKIGSIEPTTGIHGDIEYLYTLDLKDKSIKVEDVYEKKIIKTINYKK